MDLYEQMVVELEPTNVSGEYDEAEQTWTEEAAAQMSPQKHHQEN